MSGPTEHAVGQNFRWWHQCSSGHKISKYLRDKEKENCSSRYFQGDTTAMDDNYDGRYGILVRHVDIFKWVGMLALVYILTLASWEYQHIFPVPLGSSLSPIFDWGVHHCFSLSCTHISPVVFQMCSIMFARYHQLAQIVLILSFYTDFWSFCCGFI